MSKEKFRVYKNKQRDNHFYLELRDISDAAIEIWQDQFGDKKTFVRLKITESEWEKITNDQKHLQIIQKADKRVEV